MQSEPRIARNPVWALSLSLAATHKIDVSFSSSGYLDVSVHRVPSITLCIYVMVTEGYSAGFPHSDISGSKDICSSPKLFAAYHVFHRLLVPRHPPCALISLTKRFSFAGADYSSQMHSVASLVWVVYKICCIVFHITFRLYGLGCLDIQLNNQSFLFNMRFSRYVSDWHFYQSFANSNLFEFTNHW